MARGVSEGPRRSWSTAGLGAHLQRLDPAAVAMWSSWAGGRRAGRTWLSALFWPCSCSRREGADGSDGSRWDKRCCGEHAAYRPPGASSVRSSGEDDHGGRERGGGAHRSRIVLPAAGGREQQGCEGGGTPLPGGVPLGLLCREPGLEIFHRSRARASSRHCGGLGSAAGLEKIKRPFCRFLRGTKFVMGTCQCHVRGGHLQHGVRACGRLCPLLKMKKRWKEHCPALRLVRPRGDAAGPPLATPGSTPAPRSLYR